MGSYISKFVQCPFYHKDETQVIYCEGVEENTTTHLAFGSRNRCRDYKKEYCCYAWWDCRVAHMLEEKWENN